MEKYKNFLIFDNHDGIGEYPDNVYTFGFVRNLEDKKDFDKFYEIEKTRLLIISIKESLWDNFKNEKDAALFVLKTLNGSLETIYLN